jgi:HD-GYP domain-containing protein (c-di-GMP phosphodiesterase class II)
LVFGLPRKAGLLWLLVTVPATGVLALSLWAVASDWRLAAAAGLFAVAGAIAETFHVSLPSTRPGNPYNMTVGAAVWIAAVLIFPPQWAILVVAMGFAVGRRAAWQKWLYNVAQIALTAAVASLAWRLAGVGATPVDMRSVVWILLAIAAFFVVNSLLVSTIIAFVSDMPIRITWWRAHRNTWHASLGMLCVGVLIAVLWVTSPWTIALAAIPLTTIYYTLRNTVTLETQTTDALFNLADILDARDPYTHGHSLRVGQYAEKLALAMDLPGDDATLIFLSGRLHDIGKCAIKNEVLLKAGKLTDEEREHMCIHPEVGGSMLASFSLFRECARFVRGHHERWDGRGYPDGLQGEAIPLGARIIAVADAFDAMTTTRPYRHALPIAEAYRRLQEGSGTQWDARVMTVFLHLLDTTLLGRPEPVLLQRATVKSVA